MERERFEGQCHDIAFMRRQLGAVVLAMAQRLNRRLRQTRIACGRLVLRPDVRALRLGRHSQRCRLAKAIWHCRGGPIKTPNFEHHLGQSTVQHERPVEPVESPPLLLQLGVKRLLICTAYASFA